MYSIKYTKNRSGFSLMELMVVIAIVAMLIGILVPAIQSVKRIAKNLQQKSMFHAIEIGIGLYRKDFGEYPESALRSGPGGKYYTGAQHLAEAMVGRDSRGFEPTQAGKWNWPGTAPAAYELYENTPKSKSRRKPRYVNLKDTGAFDPGLIYDSTGPVYSDPTPGGNPGPVLTDFFFEKKIDAAGETVKVGSPILYFKADSSTDEFKADASSSPPSEYRRWIYNYDDNRDIIEQFKPLNDPTKSHKMDKDLFYESIADRNAPFKPMNDSSFILISAGYDCIFGTKDDVTNIKD